MTCSILILITLIPMKQKLKTTMVIKTIVFNKDFPQNVFVLNHFHGYASQNILDTASTSSQSVRRKRSLDEEDIVEDEMRKSNNIGCDRTSGDEEMLPLNGEGETKKETNSSGKLAMLPVNRERETIKPQSGYF